VNRDEIERRQFPSARRGYDPAAVDEHLRRIAEEFEALAARPPSASLAEGASTQVRAILEAAETGARQLRDDAGREASDHVERVGEAARALLARLDHLKAELDRALGGLRSSAEALAGSLDELRREAGTPAPPPDLAAPAAPAEIAAPPVAPAESVPASAGNGERSADDAGARLVALNMALEGAPREQAAGYLAAHFDLADVNALLDSVYASAGR